MITWTESPMILEPVLGFNPPKNQADNSNHNKGHLFFRISIHASGSLFMRNDNQIEKRLYMVDGEILWVDKDSFCSALFRTPPHNKQQEAKIIKVCYIYPIQRSLWYKRYFAWPASCSPLQPVFVGSCLKKQRPQKGLSSQKPVDQEIHPTKINQPTSTNQNQPPKSINQHIPLFLHLLQSPPTSWTQPLPTWNGTTLETSQKATDVEVRHASQDHPSTLAETNSKRTWKWMLRRVVCFFWPGLFSGAMVG